MTQEQPISTDALIREMYSDVKVVMVKTTELAVHQKNTNGRISAIEISQAKSEGAIAFARWMLGAVLAVMAVGASLAGVILGIVLTGG